MAHTPNASVSQIGDLMYRFAVAFFLVTGIATGTTANAGNAPEAKYGLSVEAFTAAPLRASATIRLDAPPETVWAYLSDHENLVEYSGGVIQRVAVTYSDTTNDGVGVRRECEAGPDRFEEEVVFFEPGKGFAYSAVSNTWGLKDHLATVSIVRDRKGSKVIWNQYFDHVQPEMADKVGANVQKMLEGPIAGALVKRFGGRLQ